MGELEKRFFSRKHETAVKPNSESAIVVGKVLKKAIATGNFVLRGGQSSKFNFRFDSVYDTIEASLVVRRDLDPEDLNIDAIMQSSGGAISEEKKRRFFRARCAFLTR